MLLHQTNLVLLLSPSSSLKRIRSVIDLRVIMAHALGAVGAVGGVEVEF